MGPPEHPSQQSEGIGSSGPPTLADRDLLGKLVQGQVGTARPERRLYTECAAGQKANAVLKTILFSIFKTILKTILPITVRTKPLLKIITRVGIDSNFPRPINSISFN